MILFRHLIYFVKMRLDTDKLHLFGGKGNKQASDKLCARVLMRHLIGILLDCVIDMSDWLRCVKRNHRDIP